MNELEAEIAKAKAELAAARAELAAIDAGKLPRTPKAKRPAKRPARTPVHHPESDLKSKVEGYGGMAPVGTRLRTNMTPVVTKHVDARTRPVRDKDAIKLSVMIFDAAAVWQPGASAVMTEREADELESILPFGWTLTSRPVK